MPDKSEKERRKQMKRALRKKAREEFEANPPLKRVVFENPFDYLDNKLTNYGCDNSLKLTLQFLAENNIPNIYKTIEWLGENGGGCDCEVLANVEETFGNSPI